jgi:hypothetical protein
LSPESECQSHARSATRQDVKKVIEAIKNRIELRGNLAAMLAAAGLAGVETDRTLRTV